LHIKLFIIKLQVTNPQLTALRLRGIESVVNKKLRYRTQHSASVVLSWFTR